MPRIITYSLRLEARNSDAYYRDMARFADAWQSNALHAARDVIIHFRAFRRELDQPDRSEAECAFELLALGVMLREHGTEAMHLPKRLGRALEALIGAQERWPKAEGAVKIARGLIGWLGSHKPAGAAGASDVSRLIDWLKANGEEVRAARFAQWQDFFEDLGAASAREALVRCLALADDFAIDSYLALGQYTEEVEHFLSEVAPKYRWRYDAELLSRSRVEYHLGMLGTEILSRAYRERFLAAKRKIVIVPPCMRAQPEEKCKAIQTPLGAKCQACTPTCRVHQITKLGEKHGFEVCIIPDELRGFGIEAGRTLSGISLVGVACALTNWSGGWEAEVLGVPAQGVLLDYVGCKYHWDRDGIPTDTNLKRLQEVVGIAEHSVKRDE